MDSSLVGRSSHPGPASALSAARLHLISVMQPPACVPSPGAGGMQRRIVISLRLAVPNGVKLQDGIAAGLPPDHLDWQHGGLPAPRAASVCSSCSRKGAPKPPVRSHRRLFFFMPGIPRLIRGEFLLPEVGIVLRLGGMERTAVPPPHLRGTGTGTGTGTMGPGATTVVR